MKTHTLTFTEGEIVALVFGAVMVDHFIRHEITLALNTPESRYTIPMLDKAFSKALIDMNIQKEDFPVFMQSLQDKFIALENSQSTIIPS